MLTRGDGGGSTSGGGWDGHTVDIMWKVLENQDPAVYRKLAAGWEKTHLLMSTHIWRVQEYRDKLAQAWPPESSSAARKYIERLENLIAGLKVTQDAAYTNQQTMTGVAGALETARPVIQKYYNQHSAQQSEIQLYVKAKEAGKIFREADPPFTSAQQQAVQAAAAAEMNKLSVQLSEARVKITKPNKNPGGIQDDTDQQSNVGPQPVAIPPITILAHDEPSGSSPSRNSPSTSTFGPTPSVDGRPGNQPVIGPTLEGTKPPTVTTVDPTRITPTPQSPTLGPHTPTGPMIGNRLPAKDGTYNKTGTPKGTFANGSPNTSPPPTRPMMPGGVVGGQPATTIPRGTPAQRANPVGGVIGGSNVATHNAAATQHPLGPVPGRSAERGVDANDTRWDPDNPWEVEEGVAPVLEARPEVEFDPGPAIGLNR